MVMVKTPLISVISQEEKEKNKGSEAAFKALSLTKCLFTGNSKSFSKEHPRGNPRGFFKNIKPNRGGAALLK